MNVDYQKWFEYDLLLRAKGIADLLDILDEEEREWDFDKHACKGDLKMVALLASAQSNLAKAIADLRNIDAEVRAHYGKDGER